MSYDANIEKGHVRVWDAPTRLFHWSVVILVVASWFSADQGYMAVHLWSGLAILALVLFRLSWGIIGSSTARFSDFLYPPRSIVAYFKGLIGGDKRFFVGHNPAGGLMVVVMIAILLAQATTGLFSNDSLRFNGPLALLISDDASSWMTNLHGTIFNVILLLVWFHLVAVGFYLFVKRDNLVKAMFTGKKPRTHLPDDLRITFARPHTAVLVMAFILIVGGSAWFLLQRGAFL